jgi:3-phosphoshikimate 1-carboxyvinyltransferase
MRRRPIGALLEALESQGAKANSHSFPFTLKTAGLPGGTVELDASESSQMLSALLMVRRHAKSPLTVKLKGETGSKPFVTMTEEMLKQFATAPTDYEIEGDASAGSYFLALPLVTGGEIKLPNYTGKLQGDMKFLDVLLSAGLFWEQRNGLATFNRDKKGEHSGLTFNFRPFSDTFLTLAAIAPLLDSPTKIYGIAHTRKQETDRVAGMARELKRLGQEVIETEDSLEIHPRPLVSGVEIETYQDHRFAMSFGILGCYDLLKNGQPWLTIKDPGCCAKTFPAFFDLLDWLRAGSH